MFQPSPAYVLFSPNGGEQVIHSMGEFTAVLLEQAALRMVGDVCRSFFRSALLACFTERVEFCGDVIDELIPDERQPEGLLAFVAFDPALFTRAPEHYDTANSLAPAAITYENLYRRMVDFLEDHLDGIRERAWQTLLASAQAAIGLPHDGSCAVCGLEEAHCWWHPFITSGPLLLAELDAPDRPAGAIKLGAGCLALLERGEALDFMANAQYYLWQPNREPLPLSAHATVWVVVTADAVEECIGSLQEQLEGCLVIASRPAFKEGCQVLEVRLDHQCAPLDAYRVLLDAHARHLIEMFSDVVIEGE